LLLHHSAKYFLYGKDMSAYASYALLPSRWWWVIMVAVMGIACYVAQVFFTLPDIRSLRATNPASTTFIDMRDTEA
jgi:monofunctional biosynthetic peptidoglycan transglycosylase